VNESQALATSIVLTCYQVFNNKKFQRFVITTIMFTCNVEVIKFDMCNFESYQLNHSNLEPGVLSSRMSLLLFFRVSYTQDDKYFLKPVLCTKIISYLTGIQVKE
jgi:hypothetical protein